MNKVYFDKKSKRRLRRASKVAILPFANSMYGGQRTPEEIRRLDLASKVAHYVRTHFHKEVDILCCGGLPNKSGLSLAQDMKDYLVSKDQQNSIFIAEDFSTCTSEQIRELVRVFEHRPYDIVILISNFWHLLRIGAYFKSICPNVKFIKISLSPLSTPPHRIIQEILMYLFAITFDRDGTFFLYTRQKRIEDAASKP